MPGQGKLRLLAALVVTAALGLAVKFGYRGPGAEWGSKYGAGVLYEVFWVLAFCLGFPALSVRAAAVGVFLGTCAIECLQLWRPPWLEAVRATLPGAVVLGSTFDWLDFPHYVLGCILGWGAATWARREACPGP